MACGRTFVTEEYRRDYQIEMTGWLATDNLPDTVTYRHTQQCGCLQGDAYNQLISYYQEGEKIKDCPTAAKIFLFHFLGIILIIIFKF